MGNVAIASVQLTLYICASISIRLNVSDVEWACMSMDMLRILLEPNSLYTWSCVMDVCLYNSDYLTEKNSYSATVVWTISFSILCCNFICSIYLLFYGEIAFCITALCFFHETIVVYFVCRLLLIFFYWHANCFLNI